MAAKGNTGTRDTTYDLMSVIYHALQGAETYGQYINDAEQNGDQELAQFIRDARDECVRRAEQGKQLLAGRLSQGNAQGQTAAGG